MKTLHVFDNRHIKDRVEKVEKGDTIVLINQLSKKRWATYFRYKNIDENKLNIKYITVKEYFNMKTTDKKKFPFDVMLSNPPYSEGSKLLYRYFFEKGLELAENVSMIMPVNLESTYDSRKQINYLIKKHSTHISDDISHHFNVGQDNIRNVIASKKVENEVDTTTSNALDEYQIIYPDRKRLTPIKGNTSVSDNKTTDTNGIAIIDKVLRTGEVERTVQKDLVNNAPQKIKTKFAVFTNHTPSKGKFNVCIKENFKSTWSMSVFAYEVDTKEEAEKLAEWLQSETIQTEVNKLFGLKQTYAVTLEMLGKLPWYE